MLPSAIERTLAEKQEMKTKALVELTSANNANRITEEDTDDEQTAERGFESDDDPDQEDDVYNDLRAVGIAQL